MAMAVAAAGGIALRALEPATVSDWGDALWWSTVTLSTVGYGDIAPITPAGRLVAILLMVCGVGVFSYLAGLMATGLFDPQEDALAASLERVEGKLDRLLEERARSETPPPEKLDLETA